MAFLSSILDPVCVLLMLSAAAERDKEELLRAFDVVRILEPTGLSNPRRGRPSFRRPAIFDICFLTTFENKSKGACRDDRRVVHARHNVCRMSADPETDAHHDPGAAQKRGNVVDLGGENAVGVVAVDFHMQNEQHPDV